MTLQSETVCEGLSFVLCQKEEFSHVIDESPARYKVKYVITDF